MASGLGGDRGLPDGLAAAGLFPAARLGGLLVVLVCPQLTLHSAPLQEFLEAPQGGPDVFLVVNSHPQAHSVPSQIRPASRHGRVSCVVPLGGSLPLRGARDGLSGGVADLIYTQTARAATAVSRGGGRRIGGG